MRHAGKRSGAVLEYAPRDNIQAGDIAYGGHHHNILGAHKWFGHAGRHR